MYFIVTKNAWSEELVIERMYKDWKLAARGLVKYFGEESTIITPNFTKKKGGTSRVTEFKIKEGMLYVRNVNLPNIFIDGEWELHPDYEVN